jgi:hypothetical protein
VTRRECTREEVQNLHMEVRDLSHIMPNLLAEQIDTLAAFAPTTPPVISLYLNTQSDDHGRDHFASFIN